MAGERRHQELDAGELHTVHRSGKVVDDKDVYSEEHGAQENQQIPQLQLEIAGDAQQI